MKATMALTEKNVISVRETLFKTFGNKSKIVVAPCMVEVYISKTKELLRSVGDVKWRLLARCILGLVYDCENRGQKIRVCLVSANSSADLIWQETVVAFTTVRSPHPAFHTFNSTKNLYEQIGLLYENKCVARMVFQALSVFTQCPERDLLRAKKDKNRPIRSQSFSVASRQKALAREPAVERCTMALSHVEVQQAFSTMQSTLSKPLTATVCQGDAETRERKGSIVKTTTKRSPGGEFKLETVFENIDINYNNFIPDLCDRPMTTDLCTTEL